jgi:hypothetical protein
MQTIPVLLWHFGLRYRILFEAFDVVQFPLDAVAQLSQPQLLLLLLFFSGPLLLFSQQR